MPFVPMISACLRGSPGSSQLQHACQDGAMRVWDMYRANGERAFLDVFLGVRDLYLARYEGPARYQGKSQAYWFTHGIGCALGDPLKGSRC